MQPEQTHPRPRGFRRRLLGDIFHGVKRYLILGVAATTVGYRLDKARTLLRCRLGGGHPDEK